MLRVILAATESGVIGLGDNLPWKIPKELLHFRKLTKGGVLLVGKGTHSVIGDLPDRTNIVVSTSNPLDVAIKRARKIASRPWVIGGKKLYESVFQRSELIYSYHISIVKKEYEGDVKIVVPQCPSGWSIEIEDCIEYIHYTYTRPENEVDSQYARLVSKVLETGVERNGRNGRTYSLFSPDPLRFDLRAGFPILTRKSVWMNGVKKEFEFFYKGKTNTKELEKDGVRIWTGNTSREFLDANGFEKRDEGEMGPMYGYQWRHFNREWGSNEGGVDQIAKLISDLIENPHSRRHLLTSYNPAQSELGVLYPCHTIAMQFYVQDDYLDAFCYNRSSDLFLGLPFNISSTSLLLHRIAKETGIVPRHLTIALGDAHIYENHTEMVKELLRRKGTSLPVWTGTELLGYYPEPTIRAEMVA